MSQLQQQCHAGAVTIVDCAGIHYQHLRPVLGNHPNGLWPETTRGLGIQFSAYHKPELVLLEHLVVYGTHVRILHVPVQNGQKMQRSKVLHFTLCILNFLQLLFLM
jgi:hypothetical protein